MSDVSHGPDWWQDEEGKWYPPHIKSEDDVVASKKNFATAPDTSEEINEENIASHFKQRYGWENQSQAESITGQNREAKPEPWAPSKGGDGARFMRPSTPSDLFSGVIGLLGAGLLIIGSFISWATAGGSLASGTVNAIGDSNGLGTLITGFACGVISSLLLKGQRKRWVGLLLALTATIALVLSIYSIADIINTSDGIPKNLIERFPSIDSTYANKAKLDLGIGIWLVLGGSAVSLLAGITGFKRNV